MEVVSERPRDIAVKGSFDVVVMGGGPAGVSAAVAAARTGASVALLERYGHLGGQATGGLVIKLCGLGDGEKQIVRGICQDVIDELNKLNAVKGWPEVTVDPEALKYVLDQFVVNSRVKLYLHSLVVDAKYSDENVEYVVIENKSGRQAIRGKMFIDTTGDGDSAKWCSLEYYQSHKGNLRPVTLSFRVGNVQSEKVGQYFKDNPKKSSQTISLDKNMKFTFNGWELTTNESEIWFDALFLKNVDSTDVDDLTEAEIISRKSVQTAFKEIRKIPGFEKSYIQDTAPQLGVRESRHIVGKYTLAKDNLSSSVYDSIAMARNYYSRKGSSISVPFRCLIPQGVNNLLFAGRCISVAPNVFDLIREIPCCMATGQAAGAASALCGLTNSSPLNIDVRLIQEELVRHNANV